MLSPSYAPDEPAHTIAEEITWLQGAFIGSLLCGVQITLSAMSFLAVLRQRMHRRSRICLLVYIFLLCATMTAGQQVSLLFIQKGFIQSRNYPGGPNAFLSDQYATPADLASASLFVFGNWMMETLMVWRCKVVCCTGERPMWIGVVFPSVLLVGEYVTASLFFQQMLQGEYPMNYALAYSGLSLLLNFTVTGVIAGRLMLHRRRMVRQFGRGRGSHYASVATVLIESASFYSGFLIIVIVCFCVGTSLSNILQQMVAQVESITSLLIIYRIARGLGTDDPGVSSVEWRGTCIEAQLENGTAHLGSVTDSAGVGVNPPSILSKEGETPMSAFPTDVTVALDEVV